MAGLMTAAQPDPRMERGMQRGMQPDAGAPGMRQADPEQQKVYEEFVAQAMLKVLYNEETMPTVLKTLEGAGDPVEGLASAAALITFQVAESAQAAGMPVNNDIVYNAGTEIFNQLADMADAAGIADFANDRDALEAAYFRGLDRFRGLMEDTGRLDRDAAMRDVERLQGMSDSGELDALLREAAENDPRMPAQGDEGGPRRHQQSAHPEFIRMGSGLGEHPPQARGEPTPGHWQHEFWHPPGDEHPQMGTPEWRSEQAKNLIPGRRTFNRFFGK